MINKTTIFIVLAVLCLNFSALAQAVRAKHLSPQKPIAAQANLLPQFIPLKLGQKIPTAIYDQQFPILQTSDSTAESLGLSQYKGKLVLLDFWAAWCTSCIYKFEALEQLQQTYADQLQVILVNSKSTKDSKERMLGILSGKNAPYIKSNLISIYNDTTLNKLFPHSYLPHYVWLGAKGEVLAYTGAVLVNKQTIQQLLAVIEKQHQKAQAELKQKP
ncbi:thiol-disulfide oxidoreductase [compost metagenome]